MPLGSPWLSKPIKKPMKYPKMKPDWEKLLLHLVGIANRTKPGQVTHKIEEIKTLISEQEEQHKMEILGEAAKLATKDINKLKQQHREELEGLKKKEKDEYSHGALGMVDVRYEQNKGYNKAVRDNNEAITNLLEQKGK